MLAHFAENIEIEAVNIITNVCLNEDDSRETILKKIQFNFVAED